MVRRILPALALMALLGALLVSLPTTASADDSHIKKAAKGELRPAKMKEGSHTKQAPFYSPAVLEAAAQVLDRSQQADNSSGSLGSISVTSLGCGNRNTDGNVRVNQDCTYRRQAEELIKANPANPSNLIVGQNDSRVGFNHCGFAYSFNSGQTWGDGQPPFFQRLNSPPAGHTIVGGTGTAHTYDAASDPALAFDSQGRAFYSCILFDVNTNASAVLVAMSPQGAGGSFYNNIPAGGNAYVADEENSALAALDKEFITADSYVGSPFQDRVYATWTVFKFSLACVVPIVNPGGYCSSKIYFASSSDHARTWTTPKEISGKSPLCFFGNAFDATQTADTCDFDQGSDPVVLPSGKLVVVFNNGNTAADNPNSQQLAVTSSDGGTTWSSPAFVGDDVTVGEPVCNFGRGPEECIPGAWIRTNDFPRLAVNRANGDLFATWQDYRNGEFDIQLAMSKNGGKNWTTAEAPVNPDSGKDHYFAAVDVVAGEGDRVGNSYFRTNRVPNENTPVVFTPGTQPGVQAEPSDYSLAGGNGLDTPYTAMKISPTFGPPDGNQAGFNGDYSGLVLVGTIAHPVWSDTRNSAPPGQVIPNAVGHDEDIFTDAIPLPGGEGGGDHSG